MVIETKMLVRCDFFRVLPTHWTITGAGFLAWYFPVAEQFRNAPTSTEVAFNAKSAYDRKTAVAKLDVLAAHLGCSAQIKLRP